MPNSSDRFIPQYNPVTIQEIADATGYSRTDFWRWRQKNDIILPTGKVNFINQKLIYFKLYGEEYKE